MTEHQNSDEVANRLLLSLPKASLGRLQPALELRAIATPGKGRVQSWAIEEASVRELTLRDKLRRVGKIE